MSAGIGYEKSHSHDACPQGDYRIVLAKVWDAYEAERMKSAVSEETQS